MYPSSLLILLLSVCITGFASLVALGEQDPADPEAHALTMYSYAFIPPLEQHRGEASDLILCDPTVIPFSGWQLFDLEGNEQPWLKRTDAFHMNPGGAGNWYRGNHQSRLMLCFESREELFYVKANYRHKNQSFYIGDYGTSSTAQHRDGMNHYQHVALYSEKSELPNRVALSLHAIYAELEPVAEFDRDTALPAGDELLKVGYFGKPRKNYKSYREISKDSMRLFDNNEPGTEIATRQEHKIPGWNYRFIVSTKGKKPLRSIGTFKDTGRAYYYNVKPEEIEKIQLFRQKIIEQNLAPFSLQQALDQYNLPASMQRLTIDPADQFGLPEHLALDLKGNHAEPFVNLDTATSYFMPEDTRFESLGRFLDKHQIDLRLHIDDKGRLAIRSLATTLLPVAATLWEQSPEDCYAWVKKNRPKAVYDIQPLDLRATRGEQPPIYLATTSDGGLVLFRVLRLEEIDTGNVEAEIEIRKMNLVS